MPSVAYKQIFIQRLELCGIQGEIRGTLTTSEVNDTETWIIKQDLSGINLSDPLSNLKSLILVQDDKGVLGVAGKGFHTLQPEAFSSTG
ncbi:hypothetical protein TNCV_38611 [Trichonephila clavipes]|nr:hypothetical protein TNCV_38611 [Trichonephila clavipes]